MVLAMLFPLGLATAFTGCGGSSSTKAPASTRLTVGASSAPTSAQCGFADLGNGTRRARGSTRPPASGVYRYRITGTETVPGSGGKRKLPPVSESTVSPPAEKSGVSCFGVENRYSPRTANTRVYLIRGDDVYVVAAGFNTQNFVATVLPRPAILAVAGSGTRWSGSFSGHTSGTYRVEILERGSIKVGGKRVKAVRLSSKALFQGEVEGSQTADTWLAEGRSLVLREKSTVNLRFGGDTEALNYDAKLESVVPGGPGG